MTFNADALLAAEEPWAFVWEGERHEARPVSALAVERAFRDLAPLAPADVEGRERILRRLFRLAFPWRTHYWWRGRDPISAIDAMPTRVRRELLRDFFEYQAGETLGTPTPRPQTSGSASSA